MFNLFVTRLRFLFRFELRIDFQENVFLFVVAVLLLQVEQVVQALFRLLGQLQGVDPLLRIGIIVSVIRIKVQQAKIKLKFKV